LLSREGESLVLDPSAEKYGFRNFSHFVNYYRVEEAKRMMACELFDIYTLEAIANMAGFGTRQAFYNVFEQLNGMKPACYRRLAKGQAAGGKEPHLEEVDYL
jgi:AraC-like DNA-binding protein